MSPRSALPPNYAIGSDNQNWLMRQKKKVQIWLAAGPRVPRGFFKWREFPVTLFAIKGRGDWRYENTDGTRLSVTSSTGYYLSRIQCWCHWSFAIQWPLYIQFHWIYHQKDVVEPPTYRSAFGITKMFTLGIGFKRDSDKIYFLTCNLGGNFE